jgi:Putative porin
MKRSLISAAVASTLMAVSVSPGAQAQSNSELDQLKAQLEALKAKVEDLQKQQAQQQEAQDRTTDAIAQSKATSSGADWASRIQWKGDIRLRHENVDPEEATTDQSRERIRVRFGLTAKINDTVSGVVQLATNAENNDPRSRNTTLGTAFSAKGIGFDLAYIDWKPGYGLNVQGGKMPQPFFKVGSYFWDNDITPEGLAVKYASGPFFASGFYYMLGERAAASDPTLGGGQVGMKMPMGGVTLTGAVGYFNVGAVEGKNTAQPTGCAVVQNPAFFGNANGNTTVTVAGCPRLANDFNIVEVTGLAEFKAGGFPLSVFAEWLQNQEADDLDTGWSLGATLGKAADAQTWEVGYIYQSAEKDSQFGQFYDSDFGGGVTDTEGSVFKFGYAPAKNWVLNGTYFLNDRFVDAGPIEREYKRYQIDFVYKF